MLLALALAAETSQDSQAALYAALSGVVIAMISGAVAIYTAGRRPPAEAPGARYVDPPTSHDLPRALSDLLEDALADARQAREALERAERARDLWEGRARRLGWQDTGGPR